MKNRPAMPPIKFNMYNITSRRVIEYDMTARLGEVRKATAPGQLIIEMMTGMSSRVECE